MSRKASARSGLEQRITEQLGRRLSARTLLFHQAIADRLGLNPTDLKCLDLARAERDITAGRIAELTGLTTAAVTSVIDRLERSGLIRREKDPGDRRKVIVRTVPGRAAEIGKLFESLDRAMRQLFARYTNAELELIQAFASQMDQLMQAETLKLRETEDPNNPQNSLK
jgi:DNA-binding MarR family transcriptional regulator